MDLILTGKESAAGQGLEETRPHVNHLKLNKTKTNNKFICQAYWWYVVLF